MAKTGAERQRAYKARLNASKPKKIAKSGAERQRECRQRAKMMKNLALAELNRPSTSQEIKFYVDGSHETSFENVWRVPIIPPKIEAVTPEAFGKMCRVCLSTTECMRDIFKEKCSNDSNLVNILMECSSIQISSTDGLPSVICASCTDHLETFVWFKKRCAESKTILERYRESIADRFVYVKEEPIDITDNFLETDIKAEVDSSEKEIDDEATDFPTVNLDKFQCDLCWKSFTLKANLNRHRRIHTGERLFRCDVCDKSFTSKHVFDLHSRIHTGQKPYTCTICNKSFTFKHNFKNHTRHHTGEKPYDCETCGKSFRIKHLLDGHARTHSGEKPFECGSCTKTFSLKRNLDIHQRTHTGDRPYVCDVCDKSFTVKQNLNRHLRIHTGERPYKCHICEKMFTQNRNLKKHMVVHSSAETSTCDKTFDEIKSELSAHEECHM